MKKQIRRINLIPRKQRSAKKGFSILDIDVVSLAILICGFAALPKSLLAGFLLIAVGIVKQFCKLKF